VTGDWYYSVSCTLLSLRTYKSGKGFTSMTRLNTGVYSITCLKTGKRYIGSTAQGFNIRLKTHLNSLRANKHINTKLQRAWNKYTESQFIF